MMKHFLLWGSVMTHTSASMCNESQASAECWKITFPQMQQVLDLVSFKANKYSGMAVFDKKLVILTYLKLKSSQILNVFVSHGNHLRRNVVHAQLLHFRNLI